MRQFLQSIHNFLTGLGWAGPVIFVLAYALFTVVMIPESALALAAGAFFGFGQGVLLSVLASNLGAFWAFLLARTVLRDCVERWAVSNSRFLTIDNAISQSGIKILVLLRLSPFSLSRS